MALSNSSNNDPIVNQCANPSHSVAGNYQPQVRVSIDTLLRFIDSYDGNRDDLSAWLTNCDRAFQIASQDQEQILFAFIQNKLTDRAQSVCSNTTFDNWEDLKEFLKSRFGNRKHETHLLFELQNCKQLYSETISQYISRIESCLKRLLMSIKQSCNDPKLLPGEIENTNRLALHTFLIGVNPQISLMLRSRGPNNLNEAFNIALEEEKFHLLQNSKNKICMKCNKPGHIAAHCRSYNPNKNNYHRNNYNRNNFNRNHNYNFNRESRNKPLFHFKETSFCKCCKGEENRYSFGPHSQLNYPHYNKRINYNNHDRVRNHFKEFPSPVRRPNIEQQCTVQQNPNRDRRAPYHTRDFTRNIRNTNNTSNINSLNSNQLVDGADPMSMESLIQALPQ